MKLKTLRANLKSIYNEGYGSWTLYFSDQDCDCFTITNIYEDDDGDICLEADDGYEMSAAEIYDELRGYPKESYVYIYAPEDNYYFEIEGGWYWDDEDGDLTMDIHYHPDDGEDEDDW